MLDFNPELFQCTECGDAIRSAHQGQFIRCECGRCFVDQTKYYGRYGGPIAPLSDLILTDLKTITGLGYEKDDVLAELEEIAKQQLVGNASLQSLIYNQYVMPISDLGGSSPRDLVEAGRGHKVIQYLQAVKEGY